MNASVEFSIHFLKNSSDLIYSQILLIDFDDLTISSYLDPLEDRFFRVSPKLRKSTSDDFFINFSKSLLASLINSSLKKSSKIKNSKIFIAYHIKNIRLIDNF